MKAFYFLLNAVQAVYLVIWCSFWATAGLLVLLCTFNPNQALAMARRFWAPGMLWFGLTKLRREPLPELDWTRPHIFVMNHQSMLDVTCAFVGIPANLRFVAKKSLRRVPFLGWFMWATGMIFVDRLHRARAMKGLAEAGARIRGGASVLAFPEGTRSLDGELLPFKKGVFVLALAAGVPVVPVAIENSGKLLPAGTFKLRPGVVRMKLGAPIPTAGRTLDARDELAAEVRTAILRLKRELAAPAGSTLRSQVDPQLGA